TCRQARFNPGQPRCTKSASKTSAKTIPARSDAFLSARGTSSAAARSGWRSSFKRRRFSSCCTRISRIGRSSSTAVSSPRIPIRAGWAIPFGHWDKDTLVVESLGFNDRTWLDFGGPPHTEALRTTGRFRRVDFGHISVQVTISDPGAYARSWSIATSMNLAADTELLEYVCTEN